MTEQPKLEELRKIEKWAKEHGCIDQSLEKIIPFVETLEIQQSEEYQLGKAATRAVFEIFPEYAWTLRESEIVKIGSIIKRQTQHEVWESIKDVPKDKIVQDREGDLWRYHNSRQEWQLSTVATDPSSTSYRTMYNPDRFGPFTEQKNAAT